MSALLPVYPPRVLDPAPELAGALSPAEVALVPEAEFIDPDAVKAFRGSYAKAIQRANDARDRLRARLAKGVPALKPLPGGGTNGMDVLHVGELRDLIDAHVRAQRWLWRAAEAICDAENLKDDGYREGIIWETPLYTPPEPEAA